MTHHSGELTPRECEDVSSSLRGAERRRACLTRLQQFEIAPQALFRRDLERGLGLDAVAPVPLGKVERAVTTIDQVGQRLAAAELRNADRHGDAGQLLAGGAADDLAFADGAADALADLAGGREVRARQHDNQLLATIARRQITLPQ